jgi:acyl carrier protein
LLEQLQHEALTVMDLPTAYWQQVAQAWMSEAPADLTTYLRLVTVGGERLLPQPLQRWRHQPVGSVRLLNTYGPTETTIVATLYDTAGHAEGSSSLESIPIGRPLPNRRIYILDRAGQPLPLGIAGELSIGGDVLARGYLNRAELTAERFVPDPFSCQPGARLYRTGDLVRYLADGNLQFLGRSDQQVKIRGFRIELGEIECTLNDHPGVRESVVIAREDSPGDPRLVAYIVFHPEQTSNTEQLWTYLQEHLPDYMLPAQLIVLDALPLNTNGKVDRHALLAHRPEEGEQQPHERQQPRDRIELQLLRIWERVLEREPISLTDNFFRQGGHSLAALRLHTQIQNEFQRQLPLGLLFQYPTIRELAQILRQEIGYVRGSALVPLQPHGSRAPFFCVHPGGGSVFCYLDLVQHLGMNYPVYGLQVPEVEEGQAIASVEQLAARYIAALQTVQPEGP